MARARSRQLGLGIFLVAVGLVLLAVRLTSVDSAPAWFVGLGLAFGVSGILLRSYAAVVTGCVLLGLGSGMVLGDGAVAGLGKGSWLLLALGLGFLTIYLVDALTRLGGRWWPLVPGIALVALVGVRSLRSFHFPPAAEAFVRAWWPAGLVAAGVLLLVQGIKR
jgi:hypothetical protein